jgi:uncharacterized repeat protein (TIGR01451 family)
MKFKLLSSVALVGVITPLIGVQTAFAWHPVGVITKSIQNQTTGSTLQDANDSAHAVSAKTGDTLRYVIEVRNDGAACGCNTNDMANVVVTDVLPQGLQLVSDPSLTTLTANLGTIKPQTKVTKEFIVKVTETKDAKLIENKACFTGNSTVNDNPQNGCDTADVVTKLPPVVTPQPPVTPTPTPNPTPTPPAAPVVKAETTQLPNTGAGNAIAFALAASTVGYFGSRLILSKRNR